MKTICKVAGAVAILFLIYLSHRIFSRTWCPKRRRHEVEGQPSPPGLGWIPESTSPVQRAMLGGILESISPEQQAT